MLGRTTDWTLIFGAWLIAATSTLGALFLSDVMQLAPCSLCWYQRIFMFSMVVVLAVGLFPFDRAVVRYGLPLAVIGWLFAGFHQLLIAGVIPDELQPCTQGVPCSAITIEWF
nr:disulfide bond formation protein B [Acidobacteriota bacterium]